MTFASTVCYLLLCTCSIGRRYRQHFCHAAACTKLLSNWHFYLINRDSVCIGEAVARTCTELQNYNSEFDIKYSPCQYGVARALIADGADVCRMWRWLRW
jgi:hypothetical protein